MYKNKKGEAIDAVIIIFFIIIIFTFITNNSNKLTKAEPKIPTFTGYVNDFAGVISSENENSLNSYLDELDKKTGAEVAVVTLSSLKGDSIENVSHSIGRKWGVGKKGKNNGVVILVSTGDRKMRIEVGYGLEGALPDGKAGRIRDDYMIPYFKQGNMEKGIVNGTIAVAAVIANEYKVQMPAEFNSSVSNLSTYPSYSGQSHGRKSSSPDTFAFLIFIIIFILLSRKGIFIGGYTNYGGGFGGSSGGFGGFGGGDFGGGGASGDW